jgi:hypothetical protein
MTTRPEIPEDSVSVKMFINDNGELSVGFGWNIPDPESDEGNLLYLCGMGLLWMLHENIEGLARLGATYDLARGDDEELPTAEVIPFPDKNFH